MKKTFKRLLEANIIKPYHRFRLVWSPSMGYTPSQATVVLHGLPESQTHVIRHGVALSDQATLVLDMFVRKLNEHGKHESFETSTFKVEYLPICRYAKETWYQVIVTSKLDTPAVFVYLLKA